MPNDDPRQSSPAAQRNGPFIVALLRRVLPASGRALEIASGTGEHAALFAREMPGWTWQPSDVDRASLRSIAGWVTWAALPNLRQPIALDVTAVPWSGVDLVDAIFCANMLHISPWHTCRALMHGAARHLESSGRLLTYGPYFVAGETPAPGNLSFDADLRAHDPAWGVRRLEDVQGEARRAGLALQESVPMPANNLTLVFGRS